MVIPGISIACFAALPASSFSLILMCAGNLYSVIILFFALNAARISYIWFKLLWHFYGFLGAEVCNVY